MLRITMSIKMSIKMLIVMVIKMSMEVSIEMVIKMSIKMLIVMVIEMLIEVLIEMLIRCRSKGSCLMHLSFQIGYQPPHNNTQHFSCWAVPWGIFFSVIKNAVCCVGGLYPIKNDY